MKLRLTTYFGDVFVLENPDCEDTAFGFALRGPYRWMPPVELPGAHAWPAEGQGYIDGLFYVDTARSLEPV